MIMMHRKFVLTSLSILDAFDVHIVTRGESKDEKNEEQNERLFRISGNLLTAELHHTHQFTLRRCESSLKHVAQTTAVRGGHLHGG